MAASAMYKCPRCNVLCENISKHLDIKNPCGDGDEVPIINPFMHEDTKLITDEHWRDILSGTDFREQLRKLIHIKHIQIAPNRNCLITNDDPFAYIYTVQTSNMKYNWIKVDKNIIVSKLLLTASVDIHNKLMSMSK